ncbi:MAG: T9SS type A sorting domain-containing protein [Melioribacteraceae bacterium]|nr:MAG: T9SS type A sorting domain-containing protein [Melioribacteraceae bacterium]
MKRILLLLIFVISSVQFAQFEQIRNVHLGDATINEQSKVSFIEKDDSLFCFFRHLSSLNVIVSNDNGLTWSEPQSIQGLLTSNLRNFDVSLTPQNKILISTVRFPQSIMMFNYNFSSNSNIAVGTNTSISGLSTFENLQIDENNYFVSARSSDNTLFYITSNDGGNTWSDKLFSPSISTNEKALQIAQHNNNVFVVYESDGSIKSILTDDLGENWSNEVEIFTSDNEIANPVIQTFDGKLYIAFEEKEYVELIDDYQSNVYYIVSEDGGITWSDKVQFTFYIGNDLISEIVNSGNRLLISLNINRPVYSTYSPYFADLINSVDTAPPAIYDFIIPETVKYHNELIVRAFVNDNNGIASVKVNYNEVEYELFDDGNHNDSLANDNIYGSLIPGIERPLDVNKTFIDVNNLTTPIDNSGRIADIGVEVLRNEIEVVATDINDNSTSNLKLVEYEDFGRGIRLDDISIMFAGGFMLSGYSNGDLIANGVASASLIEDYLPGNVGSDPNYPEYKIYSVWRTDTPFGQSWQDWKTAVDQGAYFYDGDDDGVYNPIDKNSNGLWDEDEDKPDILFDATYFTVYNDAVPKSQKRFNTVDPQGIEIRQTAFASANNTLLSNTVFFRYSIVNTGMIADTLKDVIFSPWVDNDIGYNYNADLVACDTLLQSAFTYKPNDYNDQSFGTNPPALFTTILQGPIKYTGDENDIAFNKLGPDLGVIEYPGFVNVGIESHVHYQSSDPFLGDPTNASEQRNYHLGTTKDGMAPDPCNWYLGSVINQECSNVNPYLWYSGDPVTQTGWINNYTTDQRQLLNTGKFDLVKEQPVDIIVAYTAERGMNSFNSIDLTRETVRYLFEEYGNNFSTLVGVEDQQDEVVNDFSLSQNFPNPFNPTSKIKYQIAKLGKVELKVYDILGREITTLVNEIKAPGTYEVTFNASQLASGVYFYRLTSGDFMQTKKMILLR